MPKLLMFERLKQGARQTLQVAKSTPAQSFLTA